MIRMIVTDLDGTLLAGGNNIPDENIRALRRAMDAGVQVALCSGRMIEATLPIARRLEVNAPMILFNGAMVYDGEGDRILAGHTIPADVARQALREIEDAGAYVQAFPGRGYFYEKATDWTAYYAGKIGVQGRETGEKLSAWLEGGVYKLLCLDSAPRLAQLAERLAPRFPELAFVKSADTHLEIVASGIDKAHGMRALGQLRGISTEEMLAFGDEENDLPMLRCAGSAYVMENAPEHVRREFKYMAPKNTQAGLAKIVNRWLDEGKMGGKQSI